MFKVYKMCVFPLFFFMSAFRKIFKSANLPLVYLKWTDENYPEEEPRSKLGCMMGLLFPVLGSVLANLC